MLLSSSTHRYIIAIAIHGASNVTLGSLLISKHYALAMSVALLEYLTEFILFPELVKVIDSVTLLIFSAVCMCHLLLKLMSRAPTVAKCDRNRVLSSWASCCGNVAPVEFEIEFASVRHLNPQQFVEILSRELRVCGFVAGENYRFGYRASGNASELVRLCEEYGISAYIINSVMDENQIFGTAETEEDTKSKERGQVSSTRVSHALTAGDVRYVTELLCRPRRLISKVRKQDITGKRGKITLQRSSLLNLPPGNGVYKSCSLIVSDEHPFSCKVVVDAWNLLIETEEGEEVSLRNSDGSPRVSALRD